MQIRTRLNALVWAAGAVLTIFSITQRADAATITVNSLADPGALGICALRDAITAANTEAAVNGCTAGSGNDTIVFSVTGTITLASTLPPIANTLTIQGPSAPPPAITFDGAGKYQVMVVSSGATVSLHRLSIIDGGEFLVTPSAGGIANEGTLTISDSTIAENTADFGGGIDNEGSLTLTNCIVAGNEGTAEIGGIANSSTLTITNSSIESNFGDFGVGGIGNSGTLTVINSTFAGNIGSFNNSDDVGGIDNFGTLTVTNSTFADNFAGHGAGICNETENLSSTMTVTNSTFVNNVAGLGGSGIDNAPFFFTGNISGIAANVKGTLFEGNRGNCHALRGGPITDVGYNLSDDDSCGFTQTTSANNVTDAELNLDPNGLQNNGGPTQTIALESSSVAINQIPVPDCTDQSTPSVRLATDQRGVIRPQFTACDIGAYEYDTAHSLKTNVLNAINATTGLNSKNQQTLKLATGSLYKALLLLSSSGNSLSPALGGLEFQTEQTAVQLLTGLTPSSQLSSTTLDTWLLNITLADRTLVVVAISNAGGDAAASQLVANGDAATAAGYYLTAVKDYAQAWTLVQS